MFARQLPANPLGTPISRWTDMSTCCGPHPRISLAPVRVLVAGDHATLRSSLRTVLEMDPRISVIGEAADDCDLMKMSKRLRPDVILMDLEMHCCDSFDTLAEISKRKLANSIIGLTIHDDTKERTAAMQAGISEFLEKGVSCKQLIDAVRRAAISDSDTED
jgi:two-component system nitrate/nitrite response regulator NarL